mgnify:FL=1
MEPFVRIFDPLMVAVQLRKVSGFHLAHSCALKNCLTALAEAA